MCLVRSLIIYIYIYMICNIIPYIYMFAIHTYITEHPHRMINSKILFASFKSTSVKPNLFKAFICPSKFRVTPKVLSKIKEFDRLFDLSCSYLFSKCLSNMFSTISLFNSHLSKVQPNHIYSYKHRPHCIRCSINHILRM